MSFQYACTTAWAAAEADEVGELVGELEECVRTALPLPPSLLPQLDAPRVISPSDSTIKVVRIIPIFPPLTPSMTSAEFGGHSGTLAQPRFLLPAAYNFSVSLSAWVRLGWFVLVADVAYWIWQMGHVNANACNALAHD
ncbi:MAG: hypothetical protein ACXVRI_03780 [Gaiellaceae bacterium]